MTGVYPQDRFFEHFAESYRISESKRRYYRTYDDVFIGNETNRSDVVTDFQVLRPLIFILNSVPELSTRFPDSSNVT